MRALYAAATGLSAQQSRIDNIANNLANVSTTGFKKSREVFEDLVYQELAVGDPSEQITRPNNLQLGTGTRIVAMSRDFSAGSIQSTGNELDLAIGDAGFFSVEAPDGTQRFTRDGHFTLNSDGEVVNNAGYLLSPGLQVPDDAESLTVAQDGTVAVTYADDPTEPVSIGTIELYDFPNSGGLTALGGNLYAATPESGEPFPMDPNDGKVNIQQGFLESSNVDVAEELVSMIVAQRAFELTSKVMEAADEALQVVSNLKR